jgi:hypothetical protein
MKFPELPAGPPLVIFTGYPGSGKSTLLSYTGVAFPDAVWQPRINTRPRRGGEGREYLHPEEWAFRYMEGLGMFLPDTIRKTENKDGSSYLRAIFQYEFWRPVPPTAPFEYMTCGPRSAPKIGRPGQKVVRFCLTASMNTLKRNVEGRHGTDLVRGHMDKIELYKAIPVEKYFDEDKVIYIDGLDQNQVFEEVKQIITRELALP